MKARALKNPRAFRVGAHESITIHQSHEIELDEDEQVLLRAGDKLHALTRKNWGFYLTESLEQRVADAGFRAALISNSLGRRFFVLVLSDRETVFEEYLQDENLSVRWL